MEEGGGRTGQGEGLGNRLNLHAKPLSHDSFQSIVAILVHSAFVKSKEKKFANHTLYTISY